MEGSNKEGKYALFSTFTFNQDINIFMIKIAWGYHFQLKQLG